MSEINLPHDDLTDAGQQLRPSSEVMILDRMGAMFANRLSFMRILLRRIDRESWRIDPPKLSLDERGHGTAVYSVHGPSRSYSLVAFPQHLDDEARTDRVIAEAWDATFVLYDGVPDDAEIARLSKIVPLQEAARFCSRELVLSRANKSMRMFDFIANTLAKGEQPELSGLMRVGYLMRTTAVYGNGKFGIADRQTLADRPEFAAPFQAEFLTVWLFRSFTIHLVEHLAKVRGGRAAVRLSPEVRRFVGVGNSTGLGMAPFLITHPEMLGRWMRVREVAEMRIRASFAVSERQLSDLRIATDSAMRHLSEWRVEDLAYQERISGATKDLRRFAAWIAPSACSDERGRDGSQSFWNRLCQRVECEVSIDAQQLIKSLIMEVNGPLIDNLETALSLESPTPIQPGTPVENISRILTTQYDWCLDENLDASEARARFWYVSATKLEPRLGEAALDDGRDRALPYDYAHQAQALFREIETRDPNQDVGTLLLERPDLIGIVERVFSVGQEPYAEIRTNLEGADLVPLSLLRCKLALFGATKFDPLSDKWLRVTLFQYAPTVDDPIGLQDAPWQFASAPEVDS